MKNFEKCLSKARELMKNYDLVKYTEYEDYYLFLGKNSNNKFNRIAIFKDSCTKKNDWQSSNLVLDEPISEIEEDIPSSFLWR